MKLRTRLTAWYAGVFMIAGVALVAINYWLLADWLAQRTAIGRCAGHPVWVNDDRGDDGE